MNSIDDVYSKLVRVALASWRQSPETQMVFVMFFPVSMVAEGKVGTQPAEAGGHDHHRSSNSHKSLPMLTWNWLDDHKPRNKKVKSLVILCKQKCSGASEWRSNLNCKSHYHSHWSTSRLEPVYRLQTPQLKEILGSLEDPSKLPQIYTVSLFPHFPKAVLQSLQG